MEQIAKCSGMPSWAAAAAHGVSSPSSPSWEEQAFACDAVANLLVWPPRSYSCTFCRREFRSAQALGGHMNVHRRDRARLRHQDDEVQEEPHEGDSFTYKQQVPVSNPSNHDLDEETGRRSKRRRVDQPPSVALPIFARSMAAALVVAPHEGFALDHSKVLTEIIPSPNSSSTDPPLVDQREVDQFIKKQQLVDLELRLGPTQKLHGLQPN
ncbi:hypothetical protein ACQ4PT_062343 [Festuca glaucescens]